MNKLGSDIQINNGGFVRIHHEILDRLATTPLTGGEFRCLMFLLRKTYGYNKKQDTISLAQWAEGTGMKRQNVWSILQNLRNRKLILCASNGPKRPQTWGFNKYFEQWQDIPSVIPDQDSDAQSVIPKHDKSVIPDQDSDAQSVMVSNDSQNIPVMAEHDKSVIPPHERTKDSKDKSSMLAADDSDDAMALVRLAYQAVCKIGPPMREQDGRANLKVATELIEHYGYAECVRGVSTLKERNTAMVVGKNKRGITAPLPYLRAIMDDEDAALTVSKGYEANAWERLNDNLPEYMRTEQWAH